MQDIKESLHEILEQYPKVSIRYTVEELISCINEDMITKKMAKTSEVLDGSIFGDREYKKISELEEGDVWVFNNNAGSLQVYADSHMWNKLRWYFYQFLSTSGLHVHSRIVMYIEEITDDQVKGVSIGDVCTGEEIKIEKDSHWEYHEETDVCLIRQDSRKAEELQCLHKLQQFYFDNKDVIENRISSIAEVAEDIFPGRTEMKSVFQTREDSLCHGLMDDKRLYCLVIHFPEIEITNKNDDVHTIKGLYVAITIGIDGSIGNFYGIRSQLEAKEIAARYGHSHMNGGFTNWSTFCLGTGDFSNNMEILRAGYDEELWEIMLTQMLYYLKWESISGGPYHRIQKAITGGVKDDKYLSPNEVDYVLMELEDVLPEEIYKEAISVKVHDSGDGSTQIDIQGTRKLAQWMEEFEDYDRLTMVHKPTWDKSYIYVSSDGQRIGYMKISQAYDKVEEYKDDRWRSAWKDMAFDFRGERVEQEPFVDESLYDETYETQIVALNKKLKKKLEGYIMMNFMEQTTEHVNQSVKQKDKYNEYKEQQKEFPEEITSCTSVF